ncbi:DUF6509 family protein [Cohnella nanjingensis]|uniref:Pullulanase n=1 Tax=Cohnella nanjingensis TaxID=1387779 RepID=A0A7X0RP96_9BACL|nr:DUF6509 family protein [Cohnella nanjingensis]MBB6671187.1 pullulanase [Cohnella nanjingensis]
MNITEYSAELVKDPFRILSGKRYEFLLDLDVDEEDELYNENGVYVKVVFKVDEDKSGIVTYHLMEKTTNRYLDFDLEAEEEAELAEFCRTHLPEED